jgi:hypothetical protein
VKRGVFPVILYNYIIEIDVYNKCIKVSLLSGGSILLKVSRIILSILVLALSGYGLITKNFELIPLMMLFLGGCMLVMGLEELHKNRKTFLGSALIVISLFGFYVSLQGFLVN